ncbi:hypothetical protein J6590_028206 [Homalodisca vitripennis]|nr:hypothetical protein J6590_028206 [Homalodisca vitripennis]
MDPVSPSPQISAVTVKTYPPDLEEATTSININSASNICMKYNLRLPLHADDAKQLLPALSNL